MKWLPLPRYPDSYSISEYGDVWSIRRQIDNNGGSQWVGGRFLKTKMRKQPTSYPYPFVTLSVAGIQDTQPIHVLVAEAFLGPRPEGLQTCHNDSDPLNNHYTNLRYDTPLGNKMDIPVLSGARLIHPRERACNWCGERYTPSQDSRGISKLCSSRCMSEATAAGRKKECFDGELRTKLSEEDVRRIYELSHGGGSGASIARQFSISPTTVYHIKSGRTFWWVTGAARRERPDRPLTERRQ